MKSNIGHTESAAGVASIAKVLLQMKHETLTATLHAEKPNLHINMEKSPFFLSNKTTPWIRKGKTPYLAGVSSFGAGGANAHIVLEEYREKINSDTNDSSIDSCLFVLSAKKMNQLKISSYKLLKIFHFLKIEMEINIKFIYLMKLKVIQDG